VNVVDSSGWIEYFFEGVDAPFFSDAIEATDRLRVPVICIYEVTKKILSVAGEEATLRALATMRAGQVLELAESLALNASLVSRRYDLAMADSMIYATLWTKDEDFRGLPNVRLPQTA
jgi:hypothetical protein